MAGNSKISEIRHVDPPAMLKQNEMNQKGFHLQSVMDDPNLLNLFFEKCLPISVKVKNVQAEAGFKAMLVKVNKQLTQFVFMTKNENEERYHKSPKIFVEYIYSLLQNKESVKTHKEVIQCFVHQHNAIVVIALSDLIKTSLDFHQQKKLKEGSLSNNEIHNSRINVQNKHQSSSANSLPAESVTLPDNESLVSRIIYNVGISIADSWMNSLGVHPTRCAEFITDVLEVSKKYTNPVFNTFEETKDTFANKHDPAPEDSLQDTSCPVHECRKRAHESDDEFRVSSEDESEDKKKSIFRKKDDIG